MTQVKEVLSINFKPIRYNVCFAVPKQAEIKTSLELTTKQLQELGKSKLKNDDSITFEIIKVGEGVEDFKVGDVVFITDPVENLKRIIVDKVEFLYGSADCIVGTKIYVE